MRTILTRISRERPAASQKCTQPQALGLVWLPQNISTCVRRRPISKSLILHTFQSLATVARAIFGLTLTISMLTLLVTLQAHAETVRLGLLIGYNGSSSSQGILDYADDDAFRYFELLANLTDTKNLRLLVKPDPSSEDLFPELLEHAVSPTLPALEQAVEELQRRVSEARAHGSRVEVYIIYSGHSSLADGRPYFELEGGRLTDQNLERLLVAPFTQGEPAAHRVHLIIDSCYAATLASRKAGGDIRQLNNQTLPSILRRHPSLGVILAKSATDEVYEWGRYQSGIFGHEVRSGMLGAANINKDGQITYKELVSFMSTANADIINSKYRPTIFVRPPDNDDTATLIPEAKAGVSLLRQDHGHYYVEDDRGIRIADFNKAKGTEFVLRLPKRFDSGRHYYWISNDQKDLKFSNTPKPITLAAMQQEKKPQSRGASANIFKRLFKRPFTFADLYRIEEHKQGPLALTDYALGVAVISTVFPTQGPADITLLGGVALSFHILSNANLFRGTVQGTYTKVKQSKPYSFGFKGYSLLASIDYERVIYERVTHSGYWSLGLGPYLGAGVLIQDTDPDGEIAYIPVSRGGLGLDLLYPTSPGYLTGLKGLLRCGGQITCTNGCNEQLWDLVFTLGFGVEFF